MHTASAGHRLAFGPDYIIPNAFDPRLISRVPPAVAKAAVDTGVARRPLLDLRRYARELSGRLDPTAGALDRIAEAVRSSPKRVVFAEGEEEKTIRAALQFAGSGYGTPVLIGREERIKSTMAAMGEDFWRYGVEESRHEIEALVQYSHEQGLIDRKPSVEELFAKSTTDISKV